MVTHSKWIFFLSPQYVIYIEVRVTRPQLPLGQVYSLFFFLIRCDFWATATAAFCYRNNTNLFVICRHSCSCKNLQWPHRLFSRITFDYFLSLYWRNLNVSIKSSFQVLLFSSFKIVPWQSIWQYSGKRVLKGIAQAPCFSKFIISYVRPKLYDHQTAYVVSQADWRSEELVESSWRSQNRWIEKIWTWI